MADLERALQIAVQAHGGQKDKNGAPYIFHPIRVMMRCKSERAKIIALLHDVVEDTTVTFAHLKVQGFSEEIVASLQLLTHEHGVSYDDYVTHIMEDPVAMEVKIADLEDNGDIFRLQNVDEKACDRLKKYQKAWKRLTDKRDAVAPPPER
jgi:(p)ppGpp synthase/HD superfamily hydrolase